MFIKKQPSRIDFMYGFTAGREVLIGGNINNTINSASRYGVGRHNADGSFDPGTGTNGSVYSVAVQSDGKVFVEVRSPSSMERAATALPDSMPVGVWTAASTQARKSAAVMPWSVGKTCCRATIVNAPALLKSIPAGDRFCSCTRPGRGIAAPPASFEFGGERREPARGETECP
jgi:hypothetical protein